MKTILIVIGLALTMTLTAGASETVSTRPVKSESMMVSHVKAKSGKAKKAHGKKHVHHTKVNKNK